MFYDAKAYLRGLLPVYSEEIHSGLDFWAKHGVDWEKGGFVTYVDRDGNWYLDEKNGWFTGRAMFSFAKGYNDIEKKQLWLDAALNLYDFMVAHQFIPDGSGRLYHHMDRDGNPCSVHSSVGSGGPVAPNAHHDESFAIMGLSELYKATGREDVKQTLYRMIETQQFIYHHPKYYIDGTMSPEGPAPQTQLGDMMSLLCSIQTARGCDPEREAYYTALMHEYIEHVFTYYYDTEMEMLVDRSAGQKADRVIDCPGHSMEVAWFMLAEGLYTKDQPLIDRCAAIVDKLFDLGWDKEHGGFSLFANIRGTPVFSVSEKLKYWWPNNELEIGLIYAYIGTKDEKFLEKYRIAHEWIFAHFPDREKGEWYGFLNPDGSPISHCKGNHIKGAYHLYRSFYAIYNLIQAYLAEIN